MPRLAFVGDYDPQKPAHAALPRALQLAASATGVTIEWSWIGSEEIFEQAQELGDFSGVWVVPGSPYLQMDGVLAANRHARENCLPFLGTCGGFQHAVIEFARNVVGIRGADHAETDVQASDLVITQLVR